MAKMPRHYAADFIAAGNDKQKQKDALAGCPAEWRDLVRAHINNTRAIQCHKQVKR